MRVLTNHLGYDAAMPKRAVVQEKEHAEGAASAEPAVEPRSLFFEVREVLSGSIGAKGACDYRGVVDRWRQGSFWELDFSSLTTPGTYRIEIYDREPGARGAQATALAAQATALAAQATAPGAQATALARSSPFAVADHLLFRETFSDVLYWFKGQRSSGAEDHADRAAAFYGGRQGSVDLRGGWFDASGDTSKYLSHLSYANHLNPQQTPGVVWAMLAARDLLIPAQPKAPALWERRLLDEIAWGADFLVRMQDPAGYFYLTLFDQWSKDLAKRVVSSFRTQKGERGEEYQAGYRQGGGMAIAALARAGAVGLGMGALDAASAASAPEDLPGAPGRGSKPPETVVPGEYTAEEYLAAAARGFDHLEEHNLEYLDDGAENIIDDYCALLAATELALATQSRHGGEERYLRAARGRADALRGRLAAEEGGRRYWRSGSGERPYYHAAEAGLPVMALLRYAECEARLGDGARRREALEAAGAAMAAELEVTGEVVNPFGYARQHVAEPGGPKRTSFFIPHRNESGYWWQGENARIASLAAAAIMQELASNGGVGEHEEPVAAPISRREELRRYAVDQINWMLGLNPFDICMLDGAGRNNPEYEAAYPNAPGGICNGITAGVEDEGDVAFLPEPWGSDPLHRWRWSEQWIPHAGWYLLAISALRAAE